MNSSKVVQTIRRTMRRWRGGILSQAPCLYQRYGGSQDQYRGARLNPIEALRYE